MPARPTPAGAPFRLASIRDFDVVPWNAGPEGVEVDADTVPVPREGLRWRAAAGANPSLDDVALQSMRYGFANDRLARVEVWVAKPHSHTLVAALRAVAGARMTEDPTSGRLVWRADRFTLTYEGFCNLAGNIMGKVLLVPAGAPAPRPGGH